uniref:Arrestin_N domain-containing protein n=1 Tax=Angiostrongylus cantonensis TaxID=6313 RepID=A0A0K0CZ36_ANGCA
MENVRVEVKTDLAVHIPGQTVKTEFLLNGNDNDLQGSVYIITSKPLAVDNIKARLYGDCVVEFTTKEFHIYANRRVLVDQEKELWHYSTLQEMLGMVELDHNANHCNKGFLMGRFEFRFEFKLPYDLATSFSCSGSPVVVKYSVTSDCCPIRESADRGSTADGTAVT